MSMTRRALLSRINAAALLGIPLWFSRAFAQSSDRLQDWLRTAAIPIRTIDARDEDYRDLEPLLGRIGDARVVQLGEPSHNAGSCFAAKARLVKFLHQRMGFGVVVWESGFYDVGLTDAALRAGDDPVAAARRGILANWASSAEVRPLFEHARASKGGDRPLVMAGFDMTLTSPFTSLSDELRSFAALPQDPALRAETTARIEELVVAFGALNAYVEALGQINAKLIDTGGAARAEAMASWERNVGTPLRPRRKDLMILDVAVEQARRLLDREKEAFAAVAGERRRGFMVRVIANLGGRGANVYERFGVDVSPPPDRVDQENRRDELNAANLRWLIEEGFPGQKFVIWAHNAHVMNAYYLGPDFKRVSLGAVPNAMKPHGVYLSEWLGKDVYTIGLTVYEGAEGWVGLQETAIPPTSGGSIEARLHQLGLNYAFVDLRAARGTPNHPLQETLAARVPKFDEVQLGNAIGAYDGLLFISRTERANLLR